MLIVLASLDTVLNIAKTFLGVGSLIFVHELGHFMVGRWCGVHAEAFSIGFGPVVLKWHGKPKDPAKPEQRTEYRLSAVPLGGYVKFLGENPDERGERDPKSFHAATYPRKVAIMLAGVTMNVIAAFVLFAATFSIGWNAQAPVAGNVLPGMPAWENGIQEGDEFVEIGGHRILDFTDVPQETAFSDQVDVVVRRGGAVLPPITITTRDRGEGLRQIGVGPSDDGRISLVPDMKDAVTPEFKDGDRVVAVDGTPVVSVGAAVTATGEAKRDTTWTVEREGKRVDVKVPWKPRTGPRLGVLLGSAKITVRRGGPAHAAGMRTGDAPVRVGSVATPTSNSFTAALADPENPGPAVVMRGGTEATMPLPEPSARKAFAESVASFDEPGQIWTTLAPGDGPARRAGLPEHCRIASVGDTEVRTSGEIQEAVRNAHAANEAVTLHWVAPDGSRGTTEVTAESLPDGMPDLGAVVMNPLLREIRETNLVGAMGLGLDRTHRWVMRIFSTISSIFSGRVSGKKLSGPLMIARGTYEQAKQSWGDLLLFLGMISMNLAVLNVLPLPLLDGGQLTVHTIERIRGKPIPERVLEGVQWAGLVLLLSLMVYVIKNDIVTLMRL